MGKFSIVQYFHEQWQALPICSGDVGSKVVGLVGSNVGIGLEASVHLARMKPRALFMTCRNEEKCERTREVLMERTGDDGAGITLLPLDLSSFDSVRAFAATFTADARLDRGLNVLVAKAGTFVQEYTRTGDDWEVMFQVNYLSMVLLSILVLPHLVRATSSESPSRLVVVSSFGHFGVGKLKNAGQWKSVLESMNDKEFFNSGDQYNMTKLFQIMFVRELAARLPSPTPVVACTVQPGFCRSNLFRDLDGKWHSRTFVSLASALFSARTSEQGSRTLVHAAVGDDGLAMHGRYLSSCRVTEEDDYIFTPAGKAFSGRLWTETIDTLSKVDGRVPEIVKQYLRSAAAGPSNQCLHIIADWYDCRWKLVPEFNPFKNNKVAEASSMSAIWPYGGKRYTNMFPAVQHQTPQQPTNMAPPDPPPVAHPVYEEGEQRFVYIPYYHGGQPMMHGMAPPPPGAYVSTPFMQPTPYPPGMPPNGQPMYAASPMQIPPPPYMPPPGTYPPPPNGAGPRPSMPPTPTPMHAHPYYHQSPQLPYPMMIPPGGPGGPPHPYEGGPAPPPMGGVGHA